MSIEDQVIPYLLRNNYLNDIDVNILIVASYPALHQENRKNVIAKGPRNIVRSRVQRMRR